MYGGASGFGVSQGAMVGAPPQGVMMMNPNPYGSPQMAPMPNYMATPVFPNQPTQMVYNQPVMYATGPTLYTPTPTGVPVFSPPTTPPMYPPSNPFPTAQFSQPQPEVVNPPAPVVEVKNLFVLKQDFSIIQPYR